MYHLINNFLENNNRDPAFNELPEKRQYFKWGCLKDTPKISLRSSFPHFGSTAIKGYYISRMTFLKFILMHTNKPRDASPIKLIRQITVYLFSFSEDGVTDGSEPFPHIIITNIFLNTSSRSQSR